MKLDEQLLLSILKFVEEQADGIRPLRIEDYLRWSGLKRCKPKAWHKIQYHMSLCDQAGWIQGNNSGSQRQPRYLIDSLTWKGHQKLAGE